jgi:hypothetical protein
MVSPVTLLVHVTLRFADSVKCVVAGLTLKLWAAMVVVIHMTDCRF